MRYKTAARDIRRSRKSVRICTRKTLTVRFTPARQENCCEKEQEQLFKNQINYNVFQLDFAMGSPYNEGTETKQKRFHT